MAQEISGSARPRPNRQLIPDPPVIYDVVIAGAGPVGLFLACELRLAGLSVVVLERSEGPHSPLKRLPFGMRGLTAPTIDAFYRRGMLDSVKLPEHALDGSRQCVDDGARIGIRGLAG